MNTAEHQGKTHGMEHGILSFYKHLKVSLYTHMTWRMHMTCIFECVCVYIWPLNVCRSHVDTGSLPQPFSLFFFLNRRIFHWIWSSHIPAHLATSLTPECWDCSRPTNLLSSHRRSGYPNTKSQVCCKSVICCTSTQLFFFLWQKLISWAITLWTLVLVSLC